MNRILVLFAFAFCSCSVLKPDYFWTCQDLTNVHVRLQGGASFDAESALGSPVITAYGAAGGNIIGAAGAAVAGVKIAGAAGSTGQRFVGSLAPAGVSSVNRHTNRSAATPTPKPAH